jgi:hypothetical protein
MRYAGQGIQALFLLFAIAAGSAAAYSAEGVTFGDKPSFQSDDKFEYALSDDKKAFTIAFQGLEIAVEGNKLPAAVAARARSATVSAPIATRAFSIVLPVTSGEPIKTAFFASGFIVTTNGAQGTLVFSVNGQNTVVKLPPNSEREFVQKLDFEAGAVSEVRMTVFLLLERDSKYPDAAAFLSVNTIDTDTALAKRKGADK